MAQLALVAVPAVLGAMQQTQAGKIKQIESEVNAAQIETAASQREADRKDALAAAVSSQNAAGGASGITFEGSPLSVLEEDIRLAEEGSERDALMARLGADAELNRGRTAESQARSNAQLGLLTTAATVGAQGFKSSAKSSNGLQPIDMSKIPAKKR